MATETMREIRKKRRLTQTALADWLGWSQVFLSAVEEGRHPPHLETLVQAEKVLGESIRWHGAPDPGEGKRLSESGQEVYANVTNRPTKKIFTQSYEWKQNLGEHAFSGRDSQGHRLDVYVEETGDPNQPWQSKIRGPLENTLLGLPLPEEHLEEAFRLDPEFQDISAELTKIRKAMTTSCRR